MNPDRKRSPLTLVDPCRQARKSEPCSWWHSPGLSLRWAVAVRQEQRQEVGVPATPVHSGGPVCVRGGRSSPGHTAQVRAGPWGLAPAGRAGISQALPGLTWGGTGAGRGRGR